MVSENKKTLQKSLEKTDGHIEEVTIFKSFYQKKKSFNKRGLI